MTQYSWGTLDPDAIGGTDLATRLDQFEEAIHTNHRGTSRPPYAVKGMTWLDSAAEPVVILKLFDGTNDISLLEINEDTNVVTPFFGANTLKLFLGRTITKTADYTVKSDDRDAALHVDASAGPVTINLPQSAVVKDGFNISIVKTDTSNNAVTVDGYSAEQINGQLTHTLDSAYAGATYHCNGTRFVITSSTAPLDGTVTTAKIQNLAVDSTKLGELSVLNGKIGSQAVTNDKIAANEITQDRLHPDVQTILDNAMLGMFKNVVEFSSSQNWTVPDDVDVALVFVLGGSGGGGAFNFSASGNGGNGGQSSFKNLTAEGGKGGKYRSVTGGNAFGGSNGANGTGMLGNIMWDGSTTSLTPSGGSGGYNSHYGSGGTGGRGGHNFGMVDVSADTSVSIVIGSGGSGGSGSSNGQPGSPGKVIVFY